MSLKLCALILAIIALMIIAIEARDTYTVDTVDSKQFGTYLTNETYFTLYRYLSDPQNDEISTCNGNCAKIWPPFYVEDLTLNPELKSRDFDVITREDGSKQLTFKGWPLYLYSRDTKPLETNGQGVNGLWFVVEPQNLTRFISSLQDVF
jgi:predicted lipoprotein with Yx(FWY)xxD motif